MDSIIFSSFVPTKDKLPIVREFLNVFNLLFKDTHIYIGINRPYCQESIPGSPAADR